ncbi:amidohydrolase family protein [Streptomyces pratensis]|nr:amidohydrolase family protein [Streptomyces pratensis]
MIIDCHGHYTTAPPALEAWRNQQIAGLQDPSAAPRRADLRISDDELRESVESNQLRLMDERGIDMTVFSPRASFMAHHVGDVAASSAWAALCNELCFRVSRLYPERFVPAAMLPQSPGVDPRDVRTGADQVRRGVRRGRAQPEPGPLRGPLDPAAPHRPLLVSLYEKMAEYDVPAMVHVSTSVNPRSTRRARTTSTPTPRRSCSWYRATCSGTSPRSAWSSARRRRRPYHWGRFRGLATALGKPRAGGTRPGQRLLRHVRLPPARLGPPVRRRPDPEHPVRLGDDRRRPRRRPAHGPPLRRHAPLRRGGRAVPEELAGVQEHNARAVYPRLDALLKRQGR